MAVDTHLLRRLKFPARYEGLVSAVGADVVKLLVPPEDTTLRVFRSLGVSVPNRSEGVFVPLWADSGTGKTTLANNLSSFLGEFYTNTAEHIGDITASDLEKTANRVRNTLPENDDRVIPILIDHRESNPITDAELATVKHFLRRAGTGARSVILWPETSQQTASDMARRYSQIVGGAPVSLPIKVEGPARSTWTSIAKHTLRLVNGLSPLDDLGVDPENYDPDAYASLGALLRAISDDFTRLVEGLIAATERPVGLIVLFASLSPDAGVLSQLTSGTELALLDPHALVDSTPDSVIGRWWNDRRGLLTQLIVRLDARAFCVPPSVVIPILRRYADPALRDALSGRIEQRSPAELLGTFKRSDVGRFLAGENRAAYETRGKPATTSRDAFEYLAEHVGFGGGRDKLANRAIAKFLRTEELRKANGWDEVLPEETLPFASLIPDIRIERPGAYLCLEFTWRKGEFLSSAHRSDVAQYLLKKLQDYGRELGWIKDF